MSRTYIKRFATEDEADSWMRMKNGVARDGSIFALVDGPSDDFAVVDLRTAIELGTPYRWSAR